MHHYEYKENMDKQTGQHYTSKTFHHFTDFTFPESLLFVKLPGRHGYAEQGNKKQGLKSLSLRRGHNAQVFNS